MKKTLLLAALVVVLVALTAGPAMAGSWWDISDDTTSPAGPFGVLDWNGDTIGADDFSTFAGSRDTSVDKTDGWGTRTAYWTAATTNPHGGFATTTNYCKTCHAVHDAGDSSYRLLKSGGAAGTQANATTRSSGEGIVDGAGSLRANECMYCHDATSGATEVRPYALGVVTAIRGEHTIGAVAIPDVGTGKVIPNRDPVNQASTFGCYDCHSVHGANIMAFWDAGLILRDDPNNDAVKVTDVRAKFASDPGNPSGLRDDYQRNNFCADCHMGNASWDADGNDATRSNPNSHVTGPDANGQLEVYGATTTVAWTASVNTRGCRGCHNSDDHGARPLDYPTGQTSAWPHQTVESKLLRVVAPGATVSYKGEADNDANRAGNLAGFSDTNRGLYNMDQVCLACHSQDSAGGTTSTVENGGWAIGTTF